MTYSTALSLTLSSLTSDHRQHLLGKQPLLSLYEAFATLPDPHSKHGLCYELAYLLSSQIAATRRHFASHPRNAFRLLLPRESTQQ